MTTRNESAKIPNQLTKAHNVIDEILLPSAWITFWPTSALLESPLGITPRQVNQNNGPCDLDHCF
jgi:hypothetical protein